MGKPSKDKDAERMKLLRPEKPFLLAWKKIFVISCYLAVLLDPLFLYVPIINNDLKCLRLDKKLKIIALVLRSVTDLCYVINIVIQVFAEPRAPSYMVMGKSYRHTIILTKGNILVDDCLAFTKWIWQSHVLVDILAVLPIPQVVIVIFFTRLGGSRSLNVRKIMGSLALFQYVPRVFRIYLLCKELNKTSTRRFGIWILFKGAFSFYLYILASHVLGAFWYFFSIQRETDCWQYACESVNGCEHSSFYCNDHTFKNITLLNNFCSLNPQYATQFDFGLFLDAIQSGVLESTNFPKKFFHCFWWGLRNLSSLGQNLQTSTYVGENLFAVFISLIGLLLFLVYLTGNLQIYMQLVTRTSKKMKIKQKMKMKDLEIQVWLSANDIPKSMKTVIMQTVKKELEQDKRVHVENILPILPLEQKRFIKRHLCWTTLKKVPMFRTLNDQVLTAICEYLKPIIFTEESYMVREGEPLVKMLFITQGIVLTYTSTTTSNEDGTNGSSTISNNFLEKGNFYGEELVNWASKFSPFSALPISTTVVKSLTKVEAFALMANDLKTIVSRFPLSFIKLQTPVTGSGLRQRFARVIQAGRR